jgi:hypothetical protein
MIKELMILVNVAALSVLSASAFARPQLTTQSIGWIESSEIDCIDNSDHVCEVTEAPFAYTFASPVTDEEKYRVRTWNRTYNFLNKDL